MQRLFLLVDPSAPNPRLRDGIVRAMQQAYFRSDGQSQTRCVRESALAAHYVLKHHNRDVLPFDQVCAATAVAAVRGQVAFVALAGDASAFAWRGGQLTAFQRQVRLARPLGIEADPRIELWSTRLEPGDRLVLVCGSEEKPDALSAVEEVLARDLSIEDTEAQLADALSSTRAVGALVVDTGHRRTRGRGHLRLLPPPSQAPLPMLPEAPTERAAALPMPQPKKRSRRVRTLWRWCYSLLGLALLAALSFGAASLTLSPPTPPAAAATSAASRVFAVSPIVAVRLGPSGTNVIDLAVGDNALYTLDVVEKTVRAFSLEGRDQQPLPDTLLVRTGDAITGTNRRLAQPVAMQYLGDGLTIVDQARTLVKVGRDRALALRTPASSTSWGELGALGTDLSAHLFVLDSAARRLLDYPVQNERVADQPRLLLEGVDRPDMPLDQAAEVIGVDDSIYVRFENGTVRRFDTNGNDEPFDLQTPDGRPIAIGGMTVDREGGLFLADVANARVLHTTADGAYRREMRGPALAGLRQLKSSVDGHRLYGLVASGVVTLEVPADDANPGDRN
jgi:hypothetical protein